LALITIPMKVRRAYVMRARAASAEATRQRILDAAVSELWVRRVSEMRLEDIAARAEVTVQTVLRVFGTRGQLVHAAWEAASERIAQQREAAAPGDVVGTLQSLFDHYEEMGDFVIRNLADEDQLPELREWLELGRKTHRRSMQRQFAPWLERRPPDQRRELLDCLVAACDVYTWKLYRRDLGLSRKEAQARVHRMVSGLIGGQ
jgi:AcrR family transcriptional regulator